MSGSALIHLLASAIHSGIDPKVVFEKYIPGFTSIHIFFSKWFRIDLTKLTKFGFFFLLYITAGRTMLSQVYEHFLGYFTSTISIPADDRINREVLTWMSNHISKRNVRFLAVQSADAVVKSPYKTEYISKFDKSLLRDALNSAGMYDLKQQPVHYYPAIGKVYFIFQGRPFIFQLLPGRYNYTPEFNHVLRGEEPILIRCLGRNSAPLKRFLEHCTEYSLQSKESMTTIYSTQGKKYGLGLEWREANVRPIRPLSTVDLATGVKQDILKDVDRYLNTSTRLFYARRGIPYRRGYLLYGPPGTGKTSFSFALAGHFGLDLYMISLTSKNLDDDVLASLFNSLPPKCIVLLEDIDSAGIDREAPNSKDLDKDANQNKKKHGISLSGLLNTIDGAASQEGRILIMTSNTPETLDAALTRHGRIDKQVKFDYISKFDAQQLFIRMFSMNEDEKAHDDTALNTEEVGINDLERNTILSHEDIKSVAQEFASKIPERKLSPAEIQGFLLDHRDDAKAAVMKVNDWIIDTLAARSTDSEESNQNHTKRLTETSASVESPHS
jgi:chaperone BCS1